MTTNEVKLPPGTPLMAKTSEAAKLFGVGRTTLYKWRRDYPDFNALTVKSNKDVLYDIPRCYQWFQDRCGGELE